MPISAQSASQAAVPPIVEIQEVSKTFDDGAAAIDGVSISVCQGEFLCLLGPSGSGKTTLLRLIAGLEIPDRGRVLIQGNDVTTIAATARRTNMVFQDHALFPHLNVFDNVGFGPRMRGCGTAEIRGRVRQALNLVQLAGYEQRKIKELSGGQRQRVAIARAIINEPAVLLLDEPLASLDMQLRGELQAELRRLQKTLGSPFISVTHDQEEAMVVADRIAVINEGRLEQLGTPAQIFYEPASLFVARFIGHNNVLPGAVAARSGPDEFSLDLGGLIVPCRAHSGLGSGARITAVIRHEAVSIYKPGASELRLGEFSAPGTLLDRVFLGSRSRYTVQLTDSLTMVAEISHDFVPRGGAVVVGDQVTVGWNRKDLSVFPLR